MPLLRHATSRHTTPRCVWFAGDFWGPTAAEGAAKFINKGTNGRWKGVLSDEQVAKYEEVLNAKLTPECAAYVTNGSQVNEA